MESAKASSSFNSALKEIQNASEQSAAQIADTAAQAAKETVTGVNQAARRNPWYFVGAAAVAAAVVGFFAGRKAKF